MSAFDPSYIVLISVCIALTIIYTLTMYLNAKIFTYMLLAYATGISIYTTVYLSSIRNKVDQNSQYNLTAYLTLYNIFLYFGLLVLYIVFSNLRGSRNSGYTRF
jgi:hypothetical protein